MIKKEIKIGLDCYKRENKFKRLDRDLVLLFALAVCAYIGAMTLIFSIGE